MPSEYFAPVKYLLQFRNISMMASDIAEHVIRGMVGEFIICSDNIPGRLVNQLDMMLDDGATAKGAMQISYAQHGDKPLSADFINAHAFYLACLSIRGASQKTENKAR